MARVFAFASGATRLHAICRRIAVAPRSLIWSSAASGEPLKSSSDGASTVVNWLLLALAAAAGTSSARHDTTTSRILWRTKASSFD